MTMMTSNTPFTSERSVVLGALHRALHWIERQLETPAQTRLRARTARIEALRLLSDDQLAARGMTRDTITAHVFAEPPLRLNR